MAVVPFLIFATLASTAVEAGGQIQAGKAARKQGRLEQDAANDQASLLEENAALADQQAADAIARGRESEARFREGVQTIIGAQRAAAAASNVDASFGSALDVQHDAAHLGELDALQIRSNAAREAWGYRAEGNDLRKQAGITRKIGRARENAGRVNAQAHYLGIAQTGLNAASSLVQMRYGFGRSGGGGGWGGSGVGYE